MQEAGRKVIEVNPKNTSQTCSQCLKVAEKKLTLYDRVFHCSFCGLEIDRDLNASRNILRLGMSRVAEATESMPL